VPEIRVHKAGPKSGLWRLAEVDDAFGNPYWAYHWGGGLALARHVLDHPAIVAGRRVLDLGAGSGIVGIAAATAGARHVLAADIDPYAIVATGLNASANGVMVETMLGDMTERAPPDVDVVLAGDTFYDAEIAARVTAFLDRCLGRDMDVLVGDPGRAFLPRERLELMAEYPGGDFGDGAGDSARMNAVFAFR
jgi:predicted nicotinamide N-methyase